MIKSNSSKNEYLDFVENQWRDYFKKKGYIQEPSVKITSKIDDSVALIGSTTNPLKKYLVNNTIGKNGRFIIQNCMRTQGLKNLKKPAPQIFGSYFKCIGIMCEYSKENLDKVVFETFDYLTNKLGIRTSDVRIRINSQDDDLVNSVKQIDSDILREVDNFSKNYYRHKYGNNVGGILGRNFNICIRKKGTDIFADIGNVVVMEVNDKKHAIEMGFGNQTLSMTYFGVDSTVAASRMADIFAIDSSEKMKFADAMIATAVLQNEGISKNAKCSYYFKRLLRQYYGSVINYWKDRLGITDDQILCYMNKFIALEYKNSSFEGVNTWATEK